MSDKQFDYIQAIAESGSLLKAADSMFITPSALSKYIQRLESELNVPLFDRVGKRFVLTYAGERYLEWQRRIHSINNDMHSQLNDIAELKEGRIRVGLYPIAGVYFSEYILPKFYERYPNIDIELLQKRNREVYTLLTEMKVDFALFTDESWEMDFFKMPIMSLERVILVPRDHHLIASAVPRPGFRYPWIDCALLKNERILLPANDSTGVTKLLTQRYGFTPHVTRQTDSFCDTLLRCVENGMGVTFGTDFCILAPSKIYDLVPLSYGNEPIKRNLVLAYHKSHYIDRASQYLIDLCKEIQTFRG